MEISERLKGLIRSAMGNTLPRHQAARLAEQIAEYLLDEWSTTHQPQAVSLPLKGKVLPRSEYSEEFDKLRKNRVEVSAYKYGPARKNFGGGRVEALKTAKLCIEAFEKDKNTEHLVDAANYLMFRFMYPYEGEYFKTTDSSGSVGTVGIPINMEG